MSLLIWIIVGAISGLLASIIVHEDLGCGCGLNVLVGMVGSLIGGSLLIFVRTGRPDITTAFTKFDLSSIAISTLGAIIFLLVLKFIRGKKD